MIQGSLTKTDGVSVASGFYGMNPSKSPLLGLIAHGYYFIVGCGAIPARLFMRKNLGERAFSPFAFLLCVGFFFWYGIIPDLDAENFFIPGGILGNMLVLDYANSEWSNLNESWPVFIKFIFSNIFLNPYLWFIVWLVSKGIKHFKQIIKRINVSGVQYSYYRGDGKFFENKLGEKKWGFHIDERFIRMVIEPLFIFRVSLVGLLAVTLIWILSYINTWLVGNAIFIYILLGWSFNFFVMTLFSSICLFLEEFNIMMKIRGATLDIIDGEYDMAFIMAKKEQLVNQSNEKATSDKSEKVFSMQLTEVANIAMLPEQVDFKQEKSLEEILRQKFLKKN